MTPVPVSPRRVFGVDFSASRDAGKNIWVCRAHPGDAGIRLESIEPLYRLPGGAVARDAAIAALAQKVTESPRSAWGFDFSFGLPRPVLESLAPGVSTYTGVAGVVAGFGAADVLRRSCRNAVPGGEARRRTDREAATPLSPYNLRIYRQTYHGIVGLVRALRPRPEVAVLPFDALPVENREASERLAFHRAASGRAPHIYLMEVCPASVLTRLGYPRTGYKGSSDDAAARRAEILRRLVGDGLVRPMPRALRNRAREDRRGDVLDAVLCAVGAWRGTRDYDHEALRIDSHYGLEGFVYT